MLRKYKDIEFEESIVEAMMVYEGFPFEEAVLTYKKRQKLAGTSFCGPNRTYPAHDAAHVRNAFVRLSTFGKRLKPSVKKRILGCLCRRAKRFGIESKFCKGGRAVKTQESVQDLPTITEWFKKKNPDIF